MDLKDLADEGHETTAAPVRNAAANETPTPPASTAWQAGPKGIKWLVLESRVLDGDQILVVFDKRHRKEAQEAHPDKVIYFPPEIEELRRHKDAPDYPQLLKGMHLIKKKFGAWIVPSNSPLARRFEPPKGGDSHGTAKCAKQTR